MHGILFSMYGNLFDHKKIGYIHKNLWNYFLWPYISINFAWSSFKRCSFYCLSSCFVFVCLFVCMFFVKGGILLNFFQQNNINSEENELRD